MSDKTGEPREPRVEPQIQVPTGTKLVRARARRRTRVAQRRAPAPARRAARAAWSCSISGRTAASTACTSCRRCAPSRSATRSEPLRRHRRAQRQVRRRARSDADPRRPSAATTCAPGGRRRRDGDLEQVRDPLVADAGRGAARRHHRRRRAGRGRARRARRVRGARARSRPARPASWPPGRPSSPALVAAHPGPLRYPGKVSASPDGARLAVSDSGHHRVLVTTLEGDVVRVVGSGMRGLVDGPLEDAAFDDPQGTAWHEGALYVADARNHAIRGVDLERGLVSTVAGTGALGRDRAGRARARARDGAALAVGPVRRRRRALRRDGRQPPDLALFPGERRDRGLRRHRRRGRSRTASSPNSAWAQPSGLATGPRRTAARARSTSPTARPARCARSISSKGEVRTLVGEGLFDFGDERRRGRRGAPPARPRRGRGRRAGCSSPTPTTARSASSPRPTSSPTIRAAR